MKKWEYEEFLYNDGKESELTEVEFLNSLGQQHWEIVARDLITENRDGSNLICFLAKREIPEKPDLDSQAFSALNDLCAELWNWRGQNLAGVHAIAKNLQGILQTANRLTGEVVIGAPTPPTAEEIADDPRR